MKRLCLCLIGWVAATANGAGVWKRIVVQSEHPAAMSAAMLMAKELGLPATAVSRSEAKPGESIAGTILLAAGGAQSELKHDGYTALFSGGSVQILGARPRSLLFAAGDLERWKNLTSGKLVRDPAFARRVALYAAPRHTIPEFVAAVGCNVVHLNHAEGAVSFEKTLPEVFAVLDPKEQRTLRKAVENARQKYAESERACREADVEFLPMIYGNDFARWSGELYRAALKVYPSAAGVPDSHSFERASLCPSDPATWKIFRAYLTEAMSLTAAHGLYATFWDHYGLYCQCPRCRANGMNTFSNEVAACISTYAQVAAAAGKELIVRTWSSGVPHWFGDQWVHAPGYGGVGGSAMSLWGKAFREVPVGVTFQTKVYNSDCEPDPPFSPLLGQAKPHAEIAEWQMTGQTTGLFFFPASTVDHTAWTMKKAYELVGAEGGVCVYPGATRQARFDLLDDIANSINIRAWRELAWNPNEDVGAIWLAWATPIYGAKAAPEIVKALRLSESAVNRTFSTLGLGSSTESGFAATIERRETLLRYTNRHYLPEGQAALAPTLENVARVQAEKDDCLRQIDEMCAALARARPNLTQAQSDELAMRFDWLKQFCLIARALDTSLWRYRYLRALEQNARTDPAQLEAIRAARDFVHAQAKRLFRYPRGARMSPYDIPLGKPSGVHVSLGVPTRLADELYEAAKACVEKQSGPLGNGDLREFPVSPTGMTGENEAREKHD